MLKQIRTHSAWQLHVHNNHFSRPCGVNLSTTTWLVLLVSLSSWELHAHTATKPAPVALAHLPLLSTSRCLTSLQDRSRHRTAPQPTPVAFAALMPLSSSWILHQDSKDSNKIIELFRSTELQRDLSFQQAIICQNGASTALAVFQQAARTGPALLRQRSNRWCQWLAWTRPVLIRRPSNRLPQW